MSEEAAFVRSPRVRAAEVGNETVLLHLDAGRYYSLNATGDRVWKALEAPRTLSELVADLTRAYAVDEATARREVETLLSELRAEGLIDLAPAGG